MVHQILVFNIILCGKSFAWNKHCLWLSTSDRKFFIILIFIHFWCYCFIKWRAGVFESNTFNKLLDIIQSLKCTLLYFQLLNALFTKSHDFTQNFWRRFYTLLNSCGLLMSSMWYFGQAFTATLKF